MRTSGIVGDDLADPARKQFVPLNPRPMLQSLYVLPSCSELHTSTTTRLACC